MRTDAPDIEDLVGYDEASRLTGWPLNTLYAKVARGEIAHVRLGPRSVRFARRDLAAMVASGYRPVAKGSTNPLDRSNATVVARSRQLAALVDRWLLAYAREMARQEIARLSPAVAKQESPAEKRLKRELQALLLRFGVRQAATAAEGAAGEVGGGLVIPPSLLTDAIAGKKTKIKWFWEYRNGVVERVNDLTAATKDAVRASVRRIIADAQKEAGRHRFQDDRTTYAAPSMGEIARRIHTQFHGREADDRIRVFSPERAAVIAQTELGQAENLGIFEGYRASGVEYIEWLARTDGRSGDRHHERMNGKRVKVGDLFRLPSGVTMRYPGDMRAPIGETINCRCTTRAVLELKRGAA